jgi:hypothetical protein
MKRLLAAGILIAALGSTALAQQTPSPAPVQHVRGRIVSLQGNVLTVGAPLGPATVQVTLAPNFRVTYLVASTLSAIAPGSFIGTAAIPQKNGTLRAVGVVIFPPGVTPNPGNSPYDLTPTSTMTNGTIETIGSTKVDNVTAGLLTVTYDGGQQHVIVTPETPVLKLVPADATALTEGARVSISARKNADGTLGAANVNVGKDGVIPPY